MISILQRQQNNIIHYIRPLWWVLTFESLRSIDISSRWGILSCKSRSAICLDKKYCIAPSEVLESNWDPALSKTVVKFPLTARNLASKKWKERAMKGSRKWIEKTNERCFSYPFPRTFHRFFLFISLNLLSNSSIVPFFKADNEIITSLKESSGSSAYIS